MSIIPKSNRQVAAEFERLGGCYHKYEDEAGGYWDFVVNKFRVHIVPWRRTIEPFRRPPTERSKLGIQCAIGHTELGALAEQILDDRSYGFLCMRWEDHTMEVPDCEPLSEGFGKLASSFLAELGSRKLDDFIAEFRQPPPDRPRWHEVFHLAALAWVGDFGTLDEYSAIFKRGKRLNFSPRISAEMIDRAACIAVDRFSQL